MGNIMDKKVVLKSISTVQKKGWSFKISVIGTQILVVAFNIETEECYIKTFFKDKHCIEFMESLVNG